MKTVERKEYPQRIPTRRGGIAGLVFAFAALLAVLNCALASVPPGCKPPELVITREHPLIILYGAGPAELIVKQWEDMQPDIRPYCVVSLLPSSLDIRERLELWRRSLRVLQKHRIPIVLDVCGDEAWWTTPLWVIETLLKEFPCIKVVQIAEMRCAFYSDFAGELDMAIPANLRYLAELIKMCGRYGKHLSLQIQADMPHLGSDKLTGPLRNLLRTYKDYFLPQNECITPWHYAAQCTTCGLWLAGYCANWGMEPQWWWFTKGESFFIKPGVFGVEDDPPQDETVFAAQARLYRAFIIEGALMGATVFSIEPPGDIWRDGHRDVRTWDNVIYPTLRQIIDQKLIATREEVIKSAKVAYLMNECSTLHQYDQMLDDIDFEVGTGYLAQAAYGFLYRHLMKEMIPDTGGRYYFIPLLPVGSPRSLLTKFEKIIHPGESTSVEGYREILNRYYPPTENSADGLPRGRAFVMKCGRAIALMQSRENLYERQPFAVEVPRWATGLRAEAVDDGIRLTWDGDPQAKSYRVWKRIAGAKVYPEWELMKDGVRSNSCLLAGVESGTFGVTAVTTAKKLLEGTLNYVEYLLFRADESPIVEQLVVAKDTQRTERISWTDESLPASQEVWRIFQGVQKGAEKDAEVILGSWRTFLAAYEAKDLDKMMSLYDPAYRDSNGYSTEYVRRAWLWWFQRQSRPQALAQVRFWDTSRAGEGVISFTAWNRFFAIQVWDEPFGYEGRVRIPRHPGERVTWTWKRNEAGQWKVIRTEPALPNFGEILWNNRGHDIPHTMADFADTPASTGAR
jgi:hypothetical protein